MISFLENESEYKMGTDKNGWVMLQKYFYICHKEYQINYYFDTTNFAIHKSDTTFRIRKVGNNSTAAITIKSKKSIDNNIVHSQEHHTLIPVNMIPKFQKDPSLLLEVVGVETFFDHDLPFGNENLIYLGNTTNERLYLKGFADYTIHLDKTIIDSNQEYYQIEIENIKSTDVKQIHSKMLELGIVINREIRGKYSKFISYYCDKTKQILK